MMLAEEPEAPKALRIQRTDHPCYFLGDHDDPNWKDLCSGVCHHPSQVGRVCHWTAARARECDLFEPSRYRKLG
jgi:hypothetical protein